MSQDLEKYRANGRLNRLIDYKALKSDNPFALIGDEEENKNATKEFEDLIDQFARQLEDLIEDNIDIGAADSMSARLIGTFIEERVGQAMSGRVGEPITEMTEEQLQEEIDNIEEEYYQKETA